MLAKLPAEGEKSQNVLINPLDVPLGPEVFSTLLWLRGFLLPSSESPMHCCSLQSARPPFNSVQLQLINDRHCFGFRLVRYGLKLTIGKKKGIFDFVLVSGSGSSRRLTMPQQTTLREFS